MTIRTVLGDVPSGDLGRILVHEHLILDNELIRREFPHIHLHSVDDAVAELLPCRDAGVGVMVDAMPTAGGRDPGKLAEIAQRSGVGIVATTGLHTEKYYIDHPWAIDADIEHLSQLFEADIESGIDRLDHAGAEVERTGVRAGVIKVATDERGMTDRARRLFAAAAVAAKRTGAPIITHTEGGLGAMDQIGELEHLGVPLDRVVISHTDKVTDPAYHEDLLESGINLEYDQALRHPSGPANPTVAMTAAMVERGYESQIMFGTDGARRSLWTALGGAPGLAHMGTGFVDSLREVGIGEDTIDTMYSANPERWLDFEGEAA